MNINNIKRTIEIQGEIDIYEKDLPQEKDLPLPFRERIINLIQNANLVDGFYLINITRDKHKMFFIAKKKKKGAWIEDCPEMLK